MHNNRLKRYTLLIIFFNYVAHIYGMDMRNQKSNLKIIRHPNGKIVFCIPIIPNEPEKEGREGFVINKESCPYRVIGRFPGARYRQCVEHALLSKDGKHFVFITGAQYRSSADAHIKNVFIIDTETFQTIDTISYQNVMSTKITMSDDGTYLTIPKKHGGSMVYDVMHHRHVQP